MSRKLMDMLAEISAAEGRVEDPNQIEMFAPSEPMVTMVCDRQSGMVFTTIDTATGEIVESHVSDATS